MAALVDGVDSPASHPIDDRDDRVQGRRRNLAGMVVGGNLVKHGLVVGGDRNDIGPRTDRGQVFNGSVDKPSTGRIEPLELAKIDGHRLFGSGAEAPQVRFQTADVGDIPAPTNFEHK